MSSDNNYGQVRMKTMRNFIMMIMMMMMTNSRKMKVKMMVSKISKTFPTENGVERTNIIHKGNSKIQ